ncbi:MAG TPA: carboxypeptidase-like regulatory domain-containing protein, partial [Usitatibacter sp.]
ARYPLSLEFVEHAKPRDEYLADVDVTILEPGGAIALEAISDGPFLLAKLPDGKYTVHAEHDGKIETRQVNVSSKNPRQVIFEWRD